MNSSNVIIGSFDDDSITPEGPAAPPLAPADATDIESNPRHASRDAPRLGTPLRCARVVRVPVRTQTKYPLVKWGTMATTNAEQIRNWWGKWPTASIGIATEPSGITVVDLDFKHVAKEIVVANVRQYLGVEVAKGLQVNTGSGGIQLYLSDGGQPIKQFSQGALGIDLKSKGSMVVAPPSIHKCGRAYGWQGDAFTRDLPPLPDAVRSALEDVRAFGSVERASEADGVDLDDDTPFAKGTAHTTMVQLAGKLARMGLRGTELADELKAINRRRNANTAAPLAEQEADIDQIAADITAKEAAKDPTPLADITPGDEAVDLDELPDGIRADALGLHLRHRVAGRALRSGVDRLSRPSDGLRLRLSRSGGARVLSGGGIRAPTAGVVRAQGPPGQPVRASARRHHTLTEIDSGQPSGRSPWSAGAARGGEQTGDARWTS